MRILCAYDGSSCSEAAIDDLRQAGLPDSGEALVVSVVETWLPPKDNEDSLVVNPYIEQIVARHREKAEKLVAETQSVADRGGDRVSVALPGWTVTAEGTYGSPAWELLSRADAFKPDLIVLGSHGYSTVERLVLGSISQKVLTEAHCSVRIARGKVEVDPSPARIIIGFDLSIGSQRAVEAVAARNWPDGTEVRLVAVSDPVTTNGLGSVFPLSQESVAEINETDRELIASAGASALEKLTASGLNASLDVLVGNAKSVLVDEAETWNADSIFVGANAYGSRLERFLIGSTSAAVAARAHCSVEVIRAST